MLSRISLKLDIYGLSDILYIFKIVSLDSLTLNCKLMECLQRVYFEIGFLVFLFCVFVGLFCSCFKSLNYYLSHPPPP